MILTIKWGHLVRFDPLEIDRWIDEARVASYDPRAARMESSK